MSIRQTKRTRVVDKRSKRIFKDPVIFLDLKPEDKLLGTTFESLAMSENSTHKWLYKNYLNGRFKSYNIFTKETILTLDEDLALEFKLKFG